ncbi:hypothetical protein Aperf_G00000116375 [Anoplocephala perfoliata]
MSEVALRGPNNTLRKITRQSFRISRMVLPPRMEHSAPHLKLQMTTILLAIRSMSNSHAVKICVEVGYEGEGNCNLEAEGNPLKDRECYRKWTKHINIGYDEPPTSSLKPQPSKSKKHWPEDLPAKILAGIPPLIQKYPEFVLHVLALEQLVQMTDSSGLPVLTTVSKKGQSGNLAIEA